MAKHTIMLPDGMVGRELRSIVRDDEAGTVEGDHSELDVIREAFAEPTPYVSHFGLEQCGGSVAIAPGSAGVSPARARSAR